MTTKKPDTDRFRITGEISTDHVGPVLAELARRGVVVTNCELITDVLRYKQNVKRKSPSKPAKKRAAAQSGVVWLTRWTSGRHLFTAKQMLQASPVTESACWAALRKLRDDKVVRRISAGEYSRIVHHRKGSKAAMLAKKMNGSTEAAHV